MIFKIKHVYAESKMSVIDRSLFCLF